eukprot:TRINITY_DN14969_c0_g1_i1.p1 TRINITY_DN14969_c0_g1~~TRINITY_DN14969_c0_g1_i1.p1  ORF type:complete len:528 (+),score=73.06 TRINITY_DN14969_c0_g1_i1:79-1662(+)
MSDRCFSSEALAISDMTDFGWFSYIVSTEDVGEYCVKSYNVWMWTFAAILFLMACLAAASAGFVVFVFIRRRIKVVCGANKVEAAAACEPTPITAIIPCYLPNEQYVIEETVNWIMHKVQSPGDLTVFVVYNTPEDLPEIENRLRKMVTCSDWPYGRRFQVLRVPSSKSKAANLNAALREVRDPYVIIYDADHHPDRQSLMLLWEKMTRLNQDCVQGSYYMRNLRQNQWGCSPPCTFPFLARIIDAEFFIDWFFMKPVTKRFLGNAYFSGSNALWNTALLAEKDFSETAQTEDVDMAVQQLLEGRNIEFCPESRSGELAPMGCRACWKQRLRWTMGWDETSLKHSGAFTADGELKFRARCGLFWVFVARWFTMLLAVAAVWVGFPLTLYWPLSPKTWGKMITYCARLCFFAGCVPWFFATVEAVMQIPHRGRQSAIQVLFVFLVSSPLGVAGFFLFSMLQQAVSIVKICTGTVGAWEVTSRGPAAGMGWPEQEESDDCLEDPESADGEPGSVCGSSDDGSEDNAMLP